MNQGYEEEYTFCPDCGALMKDGLCRSCGFREGTAGPGDAGAENAGSGCFNRNVAPTTSHPASSASAAATEESTPPDRATTTFSFICHLKSDLFDSIKENG